MIVTQTTTATKEVSTPTAASPTPAILNPTATYPVVTVSPYFTSMTEAIEAGIALCSSFRFSVKGSPEIVQVNQEYSGCDALVDACTGHAFYMRGMF